MFYHFYNLYLTGHNSYIGLFYEQHGALLSMCLETFRRMTVYLKVNMLKMFTFGMCMRVKIF